MSGEYSFFALAQRLKYINRWALMSNTRSDNLSEHSLQVAMIAHALCLIGNTRYGRKLNAERAALLVMYHDMPEIITGDMPTPVKYYDDDIRNAYKTVEEKAAEKLLGTLPDDLKEAYGPIVMMEEDPYLLKLLKAADKLSALIKCIEERESGNREFVMAERSTAKALEETASECPEVRDFMDEFLPSYGRTLDELLKKR